MPCTGPPSKSRSGPASAAQGAALRTATKDGAFQARIVLTDDQLLPVFAGQPTRFEPEARPRFVPISVEEWNKEFSTGMPDTFTGAFP